LGVPRAVPTTETLYLQYVETSLHPKLITASLFFQRGGFIVEKHRTGEIP